MDIKTFVSLARAYSNLGWAVQDQMDSMLEGGLDECNPNAIVAISELLKKLSKKGVDCEGDIEMVDEWLEENK